MADLDPHEYFDKVKGKETMNRYFESVGIIHTSYEDFRDADNARSNQMDIGSIKLQQVAAEIQKVISDDREII